MTKPIDLRIAELEPAELAALEGEIALFAEPGGRLDPAARRLDRLTRGAVGRAVEAAGFAENGAGKITTLRYPAGLAAGALHIVNLARKADAKAARRAGAALAAAWGAGELHVAAGTHPRAAEIGNGLVLRAYDFDTYRSEKPKGPQRAGRAALLVSKPEAVAAASARFAALAEGVFFTRDLVNEPANVLSTTDFAARLGAMQELGLDVEILEEEELERLGMRALLGVARGSETPARVVVMRWSGGAKGDAPLALVGKGVVFDTGGISIKPAGGMEDMTMDMGGAGVVAGVMRALALRKAKANVVGLVGLVENMPDGRAQRPGDIVRSMKGDTIEVINTDAEGRLVLADVLWYAQQKEKPAAIIDLATLTGAMIIALGHEKAGVFASDDKLADDFLKAAAAEDEGAWRMPLDPVYDKQIKSRLADVKNVGGREAGSITAARFLARFVEEGTPWIHLDIAGVALTKADTPYAPKGASGWGVRSLDRLVKDRFEKGD